MILATRCLPCACIPAPVPGETMGEAPGPLGPPIGDFINAGGAPPGGAAPGISAMDHQFSMSDMQIGMPQMDLGQAIRNRSLIVLLDKFFLSVAFTPPILLRERFLNHSTKKERRHLDAALPVFVGSP